MKVNTDLWKLNDPESLKLKYSKLLLWTGFMGLANAVFAFTLGSWVLFAFNMLFVIAGALGYYSYSKHLKEVYGTATDSRRNKADAARSDIPGKRD